MFTGIRDCCRRSAVDAQLRPQRTFEPITELRRYGKEDEASQFVALSSFKTLYLTLHLTLSRFMIHLDENGCVEHACPRHSTCSDKQAPEAGYECICDDGYGDMTDAEGVLLACGT